jgi:protein phosphatase
VLIELQLFCFDRSLHLHEFGAATNIGNQRDNNEDSYVSDVKLNLWIVADGMGGLGSGEVASAIAVHTITTMLKQGHGINQAIEVSHKKIQEYAQTEASGTNMGTTLVLLYSQASLYNIFWVGDSRAYLFDGVLSQLTHDHSLVQTLMDKGELSQEEAALDPRKSAITRALGVQERDSVRADSISEKWKENQKILLCSDGLTDCVSDEDIEKILQQSLSEQATVDNLIDKALAEGGKDNITVVLIAAPKNIENIGGDTDVPLDDTAGRHDRGSAEAMAKTNVMDQPIIKSAGRGSPTHKQGNEIPILSVRATSGSADPEEDEDDIPPKYVPGNLLSDRYLIPLGIVLAVLLVWIMMPGGSELVVTDGIENSEKTEPAGTKDPFAEMVLDDEDVEQINDQNSIGLLSTSETTQAELDQLVNQPALQRKFPLDEAQNSEQLVYQLGVYSSLTSAEKVQQDLSRFGLFAHVDKRAGNDGIRYSVILGPYPDPAEDARVVATLKRENVSYYPKMTRRTF